MLQTTNVPQLGDGGESRSGKKIPRSKDHAGSNPASGTKYDRCNLYVISQEIVFHISMHNEDPSKAIVNDCLVITEQLIEEIVARSSETDELQINSFIEQCRLGKSCLDPEVTAFRLLDCSIYFEQIGKAGKAVEVAVLGLAKAEQLANSAIQRKAHNTLGIAWLRVYDFAKCCYHLDRALQIARQLNDSVAEFAVQCNVVALLELMGAMSEAFALARRLASCPSGTPILDYMHIQNAINGIQASKFLEDPQGLLFFVCLAAEKKITSAPISEVWSVYLDTSHVSYLVMKNRLRLAASSLRQFEEEYSKSKNVRVKVILALTRAEYHLRTTRASLCKSSIASLELLLSELNQEFPLHREELLKMLLRLSETVGDQDANKGRAVLYGRLLVDHVVNTKHRQFFRDVATFNGESPIEALSATAPRYFLPATLGNAPRKQGSSSISDDRRLHDAAPRQYVADSDNAIHPEVSLNLTAFCSTSSEYYLAESWALAAEFAVDRGEKHCFEVGEVSRLLAAALGIESSRCATIGLACRLHDIGKAAIPYSLLKGVQNGSVDGHFVLRQHTVIGSRLLASASDPVLILAASIARSHHESWNGCGYPDGLKEDDIPFEGRICAVANTYLTLTNPSVGTARWSSGQALAQLIAMSGVQLDPRIVDVFVLEAGNIELVLQQAASIAALNKFNVSKAALVKTLNFK